MRSLCEPTLTEEPIEALFCDLGLVGDDEPLNRTERVIASVGAWLAERFSRAAGPAFIEDGRLAVHSADLCAPTLVH
jgi:hypothetical protein